MRRLKPALSFKTAFYAILVYIVVVLVFTTLGTFASPASSQIGTTRPTATIPGHLAELAGFGLLVGAGLAAYFGREWLPLVILVPILTVGLDLDHLPVYLGYAQPIRPAHSLIFIVVVFAAIALVIRRLDIGLLVLSATFGHMSIDTGIFAPLSPLSFDYVRLDPYRLPFLAAAVLAAVLAGVMLRRERQLAQATAEGLGRT